MPTASETIVLRHRINRWARRWHVKIKGSYLSFYLFTYLSKLLGLRAKSIPKSEVLRVWGLCGGGLQCALRRNFLGVGG